MEKLTAHLLTDDGVTAVEFEQHGSYARNAKPLTFNSRTGVVLDFNGAGFRMSNGNTLMFKPTAFTISED